MPLDNLIPIGGSGASSLNEGGKSRRGAASDLTGGLISISGARDKADVDMSDFDVSDLLLDDAGSAGTRSKGKSSKGKAKNEETSPSTAKKAKKKTKDKTKSSSGKSKSKTKTKKPSAFDDDDAVDDWTPPSKTWDSAADLELAAERRKNGGRKTGLGLDDEFAKMLGLDSGGGVDHTGVSESSGPPPLSPEPTETADQEQGGVSMATFDDEAVISGYTPTVRGSKKAGRSEAEAEAASKAEEPGSGGLSSSFFQDETEEVGERGDSSFLTSRSASIPERRGGRRQLSSGALDPFGFGDPPSVSTSALDSLFGGASSRRTAVLEDPFALSAKREAPVEESEVRRQQDNSDVSEALEAPSTREVASSPPVRPAAPVGSSFSAKDELLADLFSVEPRRGDATRSGRRQQEETELRLKRDPEIDDREATTKFQATSAVLPVAVDPAKQQETLLAELFAAPVASKVEGLAMPIQKEELKSEAAVAVRVTSQPLQGQIVESLEAPATSLSPGAVTAGASARDSLLMDLLGDLSPPKPREPLLSRRRSQSFNSLTSPEKQTEDIEDPFKTAASPSVSPPKPTSSFPSNVPEPAAEAVTPSSPETPATSPGRARSLSLSTGALAIRESDFEQSKDSLLEELLPSSPTASPTSRSLQNSPQRRNSYSLSFEGEEEEATVEEQASVTTASSSPASIPPALPIVKASSPGPAIKQETKVSPKAVESTTKREQSTLKTIKESTCNCSQREAELSATFSIEREQLQLQIDALTLQLETQTGSALHLSQQLEARASSNAQLTQQLAIAQREKLQAEQQAAVNSDAIAGHQQHIDLLQSELRGLREELSRSKRAAQDAELALARNTAERDDAEQFERHREKRALEALTAQLQRALARLTLSQQVQEADGGVEHSAARVAAEDEARLRVIASLEGSSKRAAQQAEQERVKLTELLRELETGARTARQGALEDKERLRQEQQRLDALSAHLQAQSTALRDQEAAHAAHMGQQLAEARQDARVGEARLATRRLQLERDERALYEARADFAAFREQTALEIEREREQLQTSRLALEEGWRELRKDERDLESELEAHEGEFQALEATRREVQQAEASLEERVQSVVALAEKLDAGTRELLAREQLVAQQAGVVQDVDTSFHAREQALNRGKSELEARERRLHAQIRQLESARGRFTQQRRDQQQLLAATRRNCFAMERPAVLPVDNNRQWRRSETSWTNDNNSKSSPPSLAAKLGPEAGQEEDPSGLSPALRRQVEANWQRREQSGRRRRYDTGLSFAPSDWALDSSTGSKPATREDPRNSERSSFSSDCRASTTQQKATEPRPSLGAYSTHRTKANAATTSLNQPQRELPLPPPPPKRFSGSFQPSLRVNL
ncbi:hypothetical protein BBJ28_00013014 [Nothophytophthora sp. Chile5]|nr:hypothetical protein BBJ28_00013014 [Nothophytophthora sp. Chile5]